MDVPSWPLLQSKIALQYSPISGYKSNPVISHSNVPAKLKLGAIRCPVNLFKAWDILRPSC